MVIYTSAENTGFYDAEVMIICVNPLTRIPVSCKTSIIVSSRGGDDPSVAAGHGVN